MNPRKALVFSFILLGIISQSAAQSNSPYTRYALGSLIDPVPAYLRGWGGLTAAYQAPYDINFLNPASYSKIRLTTFEVGGYGSLSNIYTKDSGAYFGDGSFSNFDLGFPIVKGKLGGCLGIAPFSRVNYSLVQINDSAVGLGQSYNYFQGKGGLYRFFVGAGYSIKGFSIGINVSYLFGELNYTNILAFADTVNAFGTRQQESRIFGDFLFSPGVQYHLKINDNYSIDFGATGTIQSNVNAKRDLLYERVIPAVNSQNAFTFAAFDTLYNSDDSSNNKGVVVTPHTISGGAIFNKANVYSAGFNFWYANWSKYSSFGQAQGTVDSWKVSVGGQWTPDYKSFDNYAKVMTYRVGFQVGRNYLSYNNKDFMEYNVMAGLGFPLRRVLSDVSIAAEWTHTGHLKDNPLAINTYKLSLGFTLNEKWFTQKKFE